MCVYVCSFVLRRVFLSHQKKPVFSWPKFFFSKELQGCLFLRFVFCQKGPGFQVWSLQSLGTFALGDRLIPGFSHLLGLPWSFQTVQRRVVI